MNPLAVTLMLLVAACFLWPSRPSPPVQRAAGEWSPWELEQSDAGGYHGDSPIDRPTRSEASLAVTVDTAADALVLCALVMRAGLGPVEALEAVAGHAPPAVAHQLRVVASAHRWGQDSATAWAHVGEGWRPAALAWEAAERSGAAPAGVVLAAAERMRREESARVEAAVQRAGVLLVLPLGVCFLPGFVGTTVVPVVLHLARTTLSGG